MGCWVRHQPVISVLPVRPQLKTLEVMTQFVEEKKLFWLAQLG